MTATAMTPRTAKVVLYQGDDENRLLELSAEVARLKPRPGSTMADDGDYVVTLVEPSLLACVSELATCCWSLVTWAGEPLSPREEDANSVLSASTRYPPPSS